MRFFQRHRLSVCAIRQQLLVGAAALLCMHGTAFAGSTVERHGSNLDVTWQATGDGTWELLDDEGHICASGRAQQGENHVNLAKVAAPTELRFRFRNTDGGTESTTRIPAIKNLSPLQKPEGSSIIYQVPVRTFLARGNGSVNSGTLNDLTDARLEEMRDFGVDYIWLTGVLEHASRAQNDPDVVKGDSGSFYAVYDNWDVSPEIGTMADFEALIDRAHAVGLRIMIDFVANHTARVHRTDVACKQHLDFGRTDRTDEFFRNDNNYYYIGGSSFTPPAQSGNGDDGVFDTDIFTPGIQLESPAKVTGNDIVSASPQSADWFETVKLNYGWDIVARRADYDPRPKTWDQMTDIARYWAEKGVDGFRIDFAHAVPVEFWRYFAQELHRVQPQVYLLAEAYESDDRMRVPNFSYYSLLDAGFDSVYDSDLYHAMRNQVSRNDMRAATPSRSPAFSRGIVDRGFMFTHYLENHDEVRLASFYFAEFIGDRNLRATLGLAYTSYLGLMPGNLMLHAGQELQEDATVTGSYSGNRPGHTSIFDFVYQSQSRIWNYGQRPQWMSDFRDRYADLNTLKRQSPFNLPHQTSAPSLIDLDGVNGSKQQSKWISSYIRFGGGEAYLVVTNADAFVAHEATIHLTTELNGDSHGALAAAGIVNDDVHRYSFREVYSRKDWVPRDPAVQGDGIPGWTLYRPGDVPSGLFLGNVPPATTYVFKIERR